MMTRMIPAVLALVVLVAGCGKANKSGDDKQVWSVRLGASGGFTGGGSGHLILKDGTVRSWSQVVPSDSIVVKDFGKATPEAMEALRRALQDPALSKVQHTVTGNMTGTLDWFDGTKMHHWSWEERVGEVGLAPPLARARTAAMTAVRTARP